jgi:hypothetical protein
MVNQLMIIIIVIIVIIVTDMIGYGKLWPVRFWIGNVCEHGAGDMNRRRNKGCTPTSNFEQYGLAHLCAGWAVADLTRPPFGVARRRQVFDAVVCDPPYGIREAERNGGEAEARDADVDGGTVIQSYSH